MMKITKLSRSWIKKIYLKHFVALIWTAKAPLDFSTGDSRT